MRNYTCKFVKTSQFGFMVDVTNLLLSRYFEDSNTALRKQKWQQKTGEKMKHFVFIVVVKKADAVTKEKSKLKTSWKFLSETYQKKRRINLFCFRSCVTAMF